MPDLREPIESPPLRFSCHCHGATSAAECARRWRATIRFASAWLILAAAIWALEVFRG